MKMQLDNNRIIKERQQRAWSQSQLAEVSGLSLRTIQRIEKNGKAALESAKALASVYDLTIVEIKASKFEPQAIKPPVSMSILSESAKTLSVIVFILNSVVFLFMLMTGLLAIVPKLVATVFSENLSAFIHQCISVAVVLVMTLVFSVFCGMLLDVFRNEGLYHHVKNLIQSEQFSIRKWLKNYFRSMIDISRFLAKPLLISGAVLLISGLGIMLTMEDYQKKRMALFIEDVLVRIST